MPSAFYELQPLRLAIDWRAQGDQLLQHVFEALKDESPECNGWGMTTHLPTDDEPFEAFVFNTNPPRPAELFLVRIGSDTYLTTIKCDADTDPEEAVGPWQRALSSAIPRLADEQPVRDWFGVIGTGPDFGPSMTLQVGHEELDGLIMRPASKPFQELVEGPVPSMGGGQISASYPVVVSGRSPGYSQHVADEDGAQHLSDLCGFLSIVLDKRWRILQAPHAFPIDPQTLPEGLQGFSPADAFTAPTPVALPAWTASALSRLRTDDELRELVQAHHQAMSLELKHPSYALLAYVAVIEGMGARYVPLERCDCCASCSVKLGSGRRFRKALALVLSNPETRQLSKAYERRSQTAHQGKLHGGEGVLGSMPSARIFSLEESRYFQWQHVWPLRRASRLLLEAEMQGELPPP